MAKAVTVTEPVAVVAPPAVYRQMVEAAGDFAKAGLGKTGVNEQQKFRFRGIDSLMDLAAPILAKHGLLVLPRVLGRTVEQRETRNGGILFSVALDVEFDFVSALDGSKHTVRLAGEAMDSGDKASNKAQSAAYKYALLQSFCIPVEGAQEEADLTTPDETVASKPEGYYAIKAMVRAAAELGSAAVKAYAKTLKDTPDFAAYDHLVKHDGDWAAIKATAEAFDKAAAAKADIKTEGTRVPGEEG
jgi:hypothetical protein